MLVFFAGENKTSRENEPLTESPDGEPLDKHMALYEVNINVDIQSNSFIQTEEP